MEAQTPKGIWHRDLILLPLFTLIAAIALIPLGWLPVDDAIYAWQAQQINQGAVPHRDLMLGRPGYFEYFNAWLARTFGNDLLALRYPLPLLTAALAAIGIGSLPRRDTISAFAVAVIALGFGFPQFSPPSHSWYCLTLAALVAGLLIVSERKPNQDDYSAWIFAAGVVAGICVGIRQLTGGFIITGALCALTTWAPRTSSVRTQRWSQWTAAAVLCGSGFCVAAYLVAARSIEVLYWAAPATFIFGSVAISVAKGSRTLPPSRAFTFCVGGAVGILPLMALSAMQGTFPELAYDNTIGVMGYVPYGQVRGESFYLIFLHALELVTQSPTLLSIGSGILLLALLSIPGIQLLAAVHQYRSTRVIDPFLAISAFLSLTAIYFQSYIYLFYSTPLVAISIIRSLGRSNIQSQKIVSVCFLCFASFALIGFGGRVAGENLDKIFRGTAPAQVPCGLKNCSLWVSPRARSEVISALEELRQVPADRPLLVLPHGAPYYLQLANPTPWRWAGLTPATATSRETDRLLEQLSRHSNTIVAISSTGEGTDRVPSRLASILCPAERFKAGTFSFYAVCRMQPQTAGSPIVGAVHSSK